MCGEKGRGVLEVRVGIGLVDSIGVWGGRVEETGRLWTPDVQYSLTFAKKAGTGPMVNHQPATMTPGIYQGSQRNGKMASRSGGNQE